MKVFKHEGDYKFEGHVVSIFHKLSGDIRIAVENADGIVHIFRPTQLTYLEVKDVASAPATVQRTTGQREGYSGEDCV